MTTASIAVFVVVGVIAAILFYGDRSSKRKHK